MLSPQSKRDRSWIIMNEQFNKVPPARSGSNASLNPFAGKYGIAGLA